MEKPLCFFLVLKDELKIVAFAQLHSDHCVFVLRGVKPEGPVPKHYPMDYRNLPLLGVVGIHVDGLLAAGGVP